MKSDIEIAQNTKLLPIIDVAKKINLKDDDLEFYGKYKAKISSDFLKKIEKNKESGKLILVTATNPTPAGEGKSTTTIGLGEAFWKLGKKTLIALREPSLGPCFGIKGGATGGGYSQVAPMEDINLHFTGDIHAITTAHNLISAVLDNSIHFGNPLNIDVNKIKWKRVLDMNDRALRNIVIGLGGKANGVPREDGFMITVASEIMAIFCLAKDLKDLKERVEQIIVAYNISGNPVKVKDLNCVGSVVALLKDALQPNLVQTLEGNPAIIHGGPFANIAHGCNSVIATKTALKLADYVITEAGFGADLGAEKFLDIKCRIAELKPSAVVIVSTIRALKYNGGIDKDSLKEENLDALEKGFCNLKQHIENIQKYNLPVVVALNQFSSDTEKEIEFVKKSCEDLGADFSLSQVWEKGGEGGIDLAKKVLEKIENKNDFKFIYNNELSIKEKIEKVAKEIYRAKNVIFSPEAKTELKKIEEFGYNSLPVCIAKTQYSFSDNPKLLGAPKDFEININEIKISAGAGFVVAIAGSIMTMPGLPKKPAAELIDVDENGKIIGLF